MKKFWLLICMASLISLMFSETRNPDRSLRGKWNFHPNRIWEVSDAGGDVKLVKYRVVLPLWEGKE